MIIVNPYGIWPTVFGKELFPMKTARVNSVRMVKAYDLFHKCPDHVITGMSTVVWGIDPSQYPVQGKTLYNGGIVGSSMIGQYYYMMRYLAQCPNISRVYLDVNGESVTSTRVEPNDMLMTRLQREVIDPADYVVASFTRTALTAAFNTVRWSWDGIVTQMLYDRGDGYHGFPEASDEVYYRNFMAYLNGAIRIKTHIGAVQIAYFKALVTELRRRDIEVIVYFGAIHPFLQYSGHFDGPEGGTNRADMYDELKRQIAGVTDFYDFSSYNSIVGEDIAHTKYFIDDIHYRYRMGLLMLKVLNGERDAGLPVSFGAKVTASNVENFLIEQRRGIDQWAADFPQYSSAILDHFAKEPLLPNEKLPMDW
jgi:hypothetical protein